MERLSIEEIIEHCKRRRATYEKVNGSKMLETKDISNTLIKEYWEHRQVAEYLLELQRYRSIGTVEECHAAVEKQRAKKPLQGEPYTWISSVRIKGRYRDVRKTSYHHVCPNCGENVAMDMRCCKNCGQYIDWSDTP